MSMQLQQEEYETDITIDTESAVANIQQLGEQNENNGTPHLEQSPEEEVPVSLDNVNIDDGYVSIPPETQTEPLGEENVADMEMNGSDVYNIHTFMHICIFTYTHVHKHTDASVEKSDYEQIKEMEGMGNDETATMDIQHTVALDDGNVIDNGNDDRNGTTNVSISKQHDVIISIGGGTDDGSDNIQDTEKSPLPSEGGNIHTPHQVADAHDSTDIEDVQKYADSSVASTYMNDGHTHADSSVVHGGHDVDNENNNNKSFVEHQQEQQQEEKGNERNWKELCDAKPPIIYLDDIDISGYKTWAQWGDVINTLRGEYDAHVKVYTCVHKHLCICKCLYICTFIFSFLLYSIYSPDLTTYMHISCMYICINVYVCNFNNGDTHLFLHIYIRSI